MNHIAADACVINPTAVWTFMAEDYMLVVRKLVASCAPGFSPSLIQHKVLAKWLRGFELRLWPSLAVLR